MSPTTATKPRRRPKAGKGGRQDPPRQKEGTVRQDGADTGLSVVLWPVTRLRPYGRNPRKNAGAVAKVAASIREFGFRQPIVVDPKGTIIVGHTRLLAALELGLKEVPIHVAHGLSAAQIKAYRLADNRVAEESTWDVDALNLELADLTLVGFDLTLTGFSPDEAHGLDGPVEGLGPPPASVAENVAELQAMRADRKAENAAVAGKHDTERYLVLVFRSREARQAALTRLGLPTDERYLDAESFHLRPRLAHSRRPEGSRILAVAAPKHSGAGG